MYNTTVTLKKGEGRTLKAGGMWVFDNEIASILGTFENGDIVNIHDFDGYFMGYGYINTNSKITLRLLARRKDTVIDEAFFEQRVRDAWNYRKETIDTSSCRLIFGEADFLPGIVIDKFSDVLVVESLALGIDKWKLVIIDALKKVLAEDGIVIRGVYERSDAKVRLQEGMERYKGFIGEPFDTKVEIVENGVHYMVDVEDGQKTGFSWIRRITVPPFIVSVRIKGAGLLHTHRLLCIERGNCRSEECSGCGCFSAGCGSGNGKCEAERTGKYGKLPMCGCLRVIAGAGSAGREI